ncbi:hypothetical protein JB92DRAFT_3124953 [Gautieria morchelliformis]|nr:hypothetical protein JB92DRAFT_3124953 [Gautieria morchelliformis]
MSTWFPDNVPRSDRAMQLSNDITLIQQRVKEFRTKLDHADDRLEPGLDAILKARNLETTEPLQQKLLEAFTPEQKKLYAYVRFRPIVTET